MIQPSTCRSDELASLFLRQISLLEELEAVLSREAVALARAGHEELLCLATDKQQLANQLTELARELDGFLHRAGHAADTHGLARLIGESPENSRLAEFRDRAIQALQACLADNRTIGGLVERRRAAVQRTLRVFFDQADAANLYHASGRVSGTSPNRLAAEA